MAYPTGGVANLVKMRERPLPLTRQAGYTDDRLVVRNDGSPQPLAFARSFHPAICATALRGRFPVAVDVLPSTFLAVLLLDEKGLKAKNPGPAFCNRFWKEWHHAARDDQESDR